MTGFFMGRLTGRGVREVIGMGTAVIARSEATKQSKIGKIKDWIASLRSQ
jgi:hypothetical protein